jgi:hypothetical protein
MQQGLPYRCDNPRCLFFNAPLLWNGQPLSLILDHKSGNARDNRPENLRFLCPNCDSQSTHTRGGANAGRIKHLQQGSYETRNRDGTQDAYVNGATLDVRAAVQAGAVTAVVPYPAESPEGGAGDT